MPLPLPAPPLQECHVQHLDNCGPFSPPCWQGEQFRSTVTPPHPLLTTHTISHHPHHRPLPHPLDPLPGLETALPRCVCVWVLHCALHRVCLGRPAGVVRGHRPPGHLHLLHPPHEGQRDRHGPTGAPHLQVSCSFTTQPTPCQLSGLFGVDTCVCVSCVCICVWCACVCGVCVVCMCVCRVCHVCRVCVSCVCVMCVPRCCRHHEVTPYDKDTTESSKGSVDHLPTAEGEPEGVGHVASATSEQVKVLGQGLGGAEWTWGALR